MSITIIALGLYAASAIAFLRYGLGLALEKGRFVDSQGRFLGSRLDRDALIRLKAFHRWTGFIVLALAVLATIAAFMFN